MIVSAILRYLSNDWHYLHGIGNCVGYWFFLYCVIAHTFVNMYQFNTLRLTQSTHINRSPIFSSCELCIRPTHTHRQDSLNKPSKQTLMISWLSGLVSQAIATRMSSHAVSPWPNSVASIFQPSFIQPDSMFARCQRISRHGFNDWEAITVCMLGSGAVIAVIIKIELYFFYD